tara:strand:- start:5442 stop:5708 length:267 start_codon:yes stop_codon:yes gene_type:complete
MKYYSIQDIVLLAICVELDYIGMLVPGTGVLTTGTVTDDKLMCDLTTSQIAKKIDHHTFEAHIVVPTDSDSSDRLGTYYKVIENSENS